MTSSIASFSYQLFKPLIEKIVPSFEYLRRELKAAGIKKTLEEYLAEALFYSFISFFIGAYLGFIFLFIFFKTFNILFLPLCLFAGFFFSLLVFFLFISLPSMQASSRKRKINNALYLATIYMATIAGSGAPPIAMFRFLANQKEFGEITKEAREIVYLCDVLGADLPTALQRQAERTPSREWADILLGIRTIIIEGGDLQQFLYEKARSLIQEHKRKIMEYVQQLSIFMEMYITLVVVGTIFVLILTTVMSFMIGGGGPALFMFQQFLIYFGFPMISIMFMIFIKALSPFEY